MIKYCLSACLLAVSSLAMAGPSELEVIGLIPGKSTEADVAAKGEDVADGTGFFVLGGYKLICVPGYLSGVLSKFTCFTGEDFNSRDTTNS